MSKNPPSDNSTRPDAEPLAAPARRRLITGGLAAGPVLMTLYSRPVLACTATRQSPSAWASGNTSTVGALALCAGTECQPPEYWRDNPRLWPSSCKPDKGEKGETQFHDDRDGFSKHSKRGDCYPKKTHMDVLKTDWSGTYDHDHKRDNVPDASKDHEFGRCMVAALLNCRAGHTKGFLDEGTIREFWAGTYRPHAGADPWDDATIKSYCKSTWS
jgi:hypothetical protein